MAIKSFAWLKAVFPLHRQAALVAFIVPRKLWFRSALAASRWHGRLASMMGKNGAATEFVMREHWLHELTRRGAFPVPWRLHGYELLSRYVQKGPVIFYSTHLAMSDMPLRVYIEMGNRPPVPVASPGRTSEGERYQVVGTDAIIPALHPGPYVLARMRSVLKQGKSIACLADSELFATELSSNPMRLARRMGVPVFFALGELAEDGVVDVTFQPAPHLFCETEEGIEANLAALREFNHRMMRSVGLSPGPKLSLQTDMEEFPALDVHASGVSAGSRAA